MDDCLICMFTACKLFLSDSDEILVQACMDSKMITRRVRGKKACHVSILIIVVLTI